MQFRLYALAAACLTLAACGGAGDSTSPINQVPSSPSNPVAGNAVTIGDDFFTPANITVSPGTTVTWTWGTGTTHNVTFDDGSTSGDKSNGATFSRTFQLAGTFNYHCTLHLGMNGTVKVQ